MMTKADNKAFKQWHIKLVTGCRGNLHQKDGWHCHVEYDPFKQRAKFNKRTNIQGNLFNAFKI
jgi:hypothetical protein